EARRVRDGARRRMSGGGKRSGRRFQIKCPASAEASAASLNWRVARYATASPLYVVDPLLASLAAQLRPVLQAFPDLALEAALRRVIESLPSEGVGEIVLAGKRSRRVVVVCVALAVAFALHELRRRVEDVLGRQQRACRLGGAHRRAIGQVGRVR